MMRRLGYGFLLLLAWISLRPMSDGVVSAQQPTLMYGVSTTGQTIPLTVSAQGAVNISGTITAASDGAIQDGANSSIEATVFSRASSNPLAVMTVDSTGAFTSASNPAAGSTGAAVPSSASYTGLNASGTLVGAVSGNGVSGTGVQRVTIASDSTGTLAGVTTVSTVTAVTSITNAVNVNLQDGGGTDLTSATSGSLRPLDVTIVDTNGNRLTALAQRCADDDKVSSAVISLDTLGNTQIVALVASKTIYVCGYDVVNTSAMSWYWITGTGTACGTGEIQKTGSAAFAANGGIAKPNAGALQFKTNPGGALCIKAGSTGHLAGSVTYVQDFP